MSDPILPTEMSHPELVGGQRRKDIRIDENHTFDSRYRSIQPAPATTSSFGKSTVCPMPFLWR